MIDRKTDETPLALYLPWGTWATEIQEFVVLFCLFLNVCEVSHNKMLRKGREEAGWEGMEPQKQTRFQYDWEKWGGAEGAGILAWKPIRILTVGERGGKEELWGEEVSSARALETLWRAQHIWTRSRGGDGRPDWKELWAVTVGVHSVSPRSAGRAVELSESPMQQLEQLDHRGEPVGRVHPCSSLVRIGHIITCTCGQAPPE